MEFISLLSRRGRRETNIFFILRWTEHYFPQEASSEVISKIYKSILTVALISECISYIGLYVCLSVILQRLLMHLFNSFSRFSKLLSFQNSIFHFLIPPHRSIEVLLLEIYGRNKYVSIFKLIYLSFHQKFFLVSVCFIPTDVKCLKVEFGCCLALAKYVFLPITFLFCLPSRSSRLVKSVS